jgi:drug/metabolite transporter (DMT)-like permease
VLKNISVRTKAELILLSITVVWASTFVLAKMILLYTSPYVYTAMRFGIASLIFGILCFKKIRTMDRKAFFRGFILGCFLFVGFALQVVGLQYTTASKSAFITGMMVVFTPIVQLLVERRLPQTGNVIGVVLVVIGLFFLTSPQGAEFNRGDLMSLGCALSFAGYLVYLGIFGKHHDPVHLTFMQFITTFVLSVPMMCTEHIYFQYDIKFSMILLYLAIMPTVVALYIQTRYQKDTTATRCAVITSLEPPIAALFALAFLSEAIGPEGILGGAFIFVGVIVSELSDYIFKKFFTLQHNRI